MNANELKAKARERLAEIAKQRAALDAEERVGDSAPPGPRDSGPDILDGLTTSAHP